MKPALPDRKERKTAQWIGRTINIGVFSDKNPFGYVDENGEYQGYDVYFARRIAEDLGVETLLNWINDEIKALAGEQFFHRDYEATLTETYGLDYEESLVLEGGGLAE